jgi:hypothetical protein
MRRIVFPLIIAILLITSCSQQRATSFPATETVVPTATLLSTPTAIPTAFPNSLYVDPNISLGRISPLVYGSNYGPWLVVSLDMLPAAYDSGITVMRFPAGSWGDHNDVKEFQIDQFMDFFKKVGATAMFNVRLLNGTPEQAAEMVRYANIEKKYNVQYWGIGNEPTLFDDELKIRGESYDVERFNKEWRAFAEAMKKVDPTIKLVGPESHQLSHDYSGLSTNYSEANEKWFIEFLKANGDLVDIVSFHRYPFPRSSIGGSPTVDDLRQNAKEWDKIIIHARELTQTYTGRDLPIAITEFNSAYDKSVGTDASPDSYYNAIWMADVLGRMIKNGVFMANEWGFTAKGGYGGLGLVGPDKPFPTYYTYQMYKKFGSELIHSSSDNDNISIYAARREDGALTVIVINLAFEEQVKAIRIADQASATAEAWLFDPTHQVENMGTVELSGELTLPAQSISLFILK